MGTSKWDMQKWVRCWQTRDESYNRTRDQRILSAIRNATLCSDGGTGAHRLPYLLKVLFWYSFLRKAEWIYLKKKKFTDSTDQLHIVLNTLLLQIFVWWKVATGSRALKRLNGSVISFSWNKTDETNYIASGPGTDLSTKMQQNK